jgi:AbrB family looped-hinge helix DNA binding protein
MANSVSYLSIDQKGRATLPEVVRTSLGLRPGDFVLLERTERGTYELVPAALVPKDQLWFHHPDMQRRIRKAEADIAEGRTDTTRGVKEAQALLDRSKNAKGGRRRKRR